MWVFGYGSLIFKQGFPFAERRAGFIRDYRRLFWQGSTDHRGVPGAPGRVVTLRPYAGACCWGVAFRVADADSAAVFAGLDYREKGGYSRLLTPVLAADGDRPFAEATTYVAEPDNPNYLGCAPLPEIAAQVRGAVGPSGSNIEYVFRLADALRAMDVEDQHVFRLEALLR